MQLDKDENVFRPETLNSSPLHSDRISISMYKAILFECKGTIQSLRFKNIFILIAFFFLECSNCCIELYRFEIDR